MNRTELNTLHNKIDELLAYVKLNIAQPHRQNFTAMQQMELKLTEAEMWANELYTDSELDPDLKIFIRAAPIEDGRGDNLVNVDSGGKFSFEEMVAMSTKYRVPKFVYKNNLYVRTFVEKDKNHQWLNNGYYSKHLYKDLRIDDYSEIVT